MPVPSWRLWVVGGFGHDGNGNDRYAGSTTDNDGPNGSDNNGLGNGNDRNGGDGAAIVGVSLAGTGVLVGIAALVLDHRATVAFRRAADRYRPQPATSLHLTPRLPGNGPWCGPSILKTTDYQYVNSQISTLV